MTGSRIDPSMTTRASAPGLQAAWLQAAGALPTATLHEAAGKLGALPWAIKPISPAFRVCGPAVTIQGPPGDNLWLHRGIYAAQPGQVLVVNVGGQFDHGYWGEIMSTAAQIRGLGGLVIDGCVRDGTLLEKIGFPVFARGLCIRGTGKDFGALGWINHPVLMGSVTVHAGDLIVGDTDGVVAIAADQVSRVLDAASRREQEEAAILERLAAGEGTLDVYGWSCP
jgi:4-hydroxy-4-methyl-2-oxoglutarate aldolase